MSDVLERIGAANPVPQEPPASAWTASVLLDEIDARRGRTTKTDQTETTPVGSPKQTWGVRIAAAAGAFLLVLAVGGVIALITNGGESEVLGASPTPPTKEAPLTTTTLDVEALEAHATSVAESFFTAFLTGDWDAANELARGVLISGQNANLLWEIDVAGIDCGLVTDFLVSCTSTQTNAVTRQVSDAYAWQSVGAVTVVDGVVTRYTSEDQPDPVFDRYEAWLDAEAPGEWDALGCEPGSGVSVPACIPIYLANVEAWLGTGPDLSEIATAEQKVSTAEAFYVAHLEGDLASALEVADDRVSSGFLEDVNVLWGIEVVGIDCEPVPVGATVTCVATQIDDLSRQISPAYTHRIKGRISVVDGVVTAYEVGLADSLFHGYEGWLDVESPSGWLVLECTHGGWGASACVQIYLANFEAWLATNPDLSDIAG